MGDVVTLPLMKECYRLALERGALPQTRIGCSELHEILLKNKSAIHWDMLCDIKDGGEIYADDELIYKDVKFIF